MTGSEWLANTRKVRDLLNQSPKEFFDNCYHYFESQALESEEKPLFAVSILQALAPSGFRGPKRIPMWMNEQIPEILTNELRWIDLCIQLRKHPQLGYSARNVLRNADKETVLKRLDLALFKAPSRPVELYTSKCGNLLERYIRGEHQEVWNEIHKHQAIGGEFLEEVEAVARETMLRVKHSADLIAQRLESHGWSSLFGSLRTKPSTADNSIIEKMEKTSGAKIPVSLRIFWEIVGGIDFVWNYKLGKEPASIADHLPSMPDALCVTSPEQTAHLIEEWEYRKKKELHPEISDPFFIDLAPDIYHKSNISGGAAYGIEIPFPGADPIFENESHRLPFVDYLRLCIRWGGFPTLETQRNEGEVRDFLSFLTKDCEPF